MCDFWLKQPQHKEGYFTRDAVGAQQEIPETFLCSAYSMS